MAELELKYSLTPFTFSKISIEHLLHARHSFRNCVHNSKVQSSLKPFPISFLLPLLRLHHHAVALKLLMLRFLGTYTFRQNFPFRSNLGIIDVPTSPNSLQTSLMRVVWNNSVFQAHFTAEGKMCPWETSYVLPEMGVVCQAREWVPVGSSQFLDHMRHLISQVIHPSSQWSTTLGISRMFPLHLSELKISLWPLTVLLNKTCISFCGLGIMKFFLVSENNLCSIP